MFSDNDEPDNFALNGALDAADSDELPPVEDRPVLVRQDAEKDTNCG
jgi:hypothetical protein